MSQIGRISGPLLKDNLVRNGVPLTFRNGPLDTDLLFLNVNTQQIGVNTASPAFALHVNGNGNIDGDLIVDGIDAKISNIKIGTNGTVSTQVGPIIIAPTGPHAYVEYGKILNTDLEIKDNYIKATTVNSDIVLDANAAGSVVFLSNADMTDGLQVNGNIGVTGNVKLDGMFYVGDSPLDTVTVEPDFTQSIIPGTNNLYNLGSSSKKWGEVVVGNIDGSASLNVNSLVISHETQLFGNTITTIQSNENLVFSADSGTVQIEQISINQGTITNLENSPITLTHTGRGYLQISDENGVVIPSGTTSERVGSEQGETRWNNEIGYMECFDGTTWQVATGGGMVITAPIMEELGNIYTLIFG